MDATIVHLGNTLVEGQEMLIHHLLLRRTYREPDILLKPIRGFHVVTIEVNGLQ